MGNRQGLALLERALACAPDREAEGATLNNLATTAHARGDYETAQRYLEQSLAIQRDIGNEAGEGAALHNLGCLALQREDYQGAAERWSLHRTSGMRRCSSL